MENMFDLNEALNVGPVNPPLDSGIVVEDAEPFHLEEALAVQNEAGDESDGDDDDHMVNVEQGAREPPEPRTMRIGESDVIFYEVDDPSGQLSEDCQASEDADLIDPSCFDIVENDSSDLDDEPLFLEAVQVAFPSVFSSAFEDAHKTEDDSETEGTLSNPAILSDGLEECDANVVLRPTSSPAPSMFSSSFGKVGPVNNGRGLPIGNQSSEFSSSSRSLEVPMISKLNKEMNEAVASSSAEADNLQVTNVAFQFSQPGGNTTFLPVCPTSPEVLTPAQVVADSAGCSKDTVQAVKNVSVSQLHDVIATLKSPDAKKISDQLDRNSLVEWSPNSIIDGLGKDMNGNHTSLSIVQLSNSLSNFNEHILVMQKELLKYETAIKESRAAGQLDRMGFKDQSNITHLSTVLNSLNMANKNMEERVTSIDRELKGQSAVQDGKGFWMKLLAATGVGAAIGSLMIFKKYK